MNRYRCPTNPKPYDEPKPWDPPGAMLNGCGMEFEADPDFEGLVDCPHCGIWFHPEHEVRALLPPAARELVSRVIEVL